MMRLLTPDSPSSTEAYCPVRPISWRTWWAWRTTSYPHTSACPPSARRRVARIRTAVVLPAPFGPSTPSTVPCRATRSTPASAVVLPKRLTRPLASIALVMVALSCPSRSIVRDAPDRPRTARCQAAARHRTDRRKRPPQGLTARRGRCILDLAELGTSGGGRGPVQAEVGRTSRGRAGFRPDGARPAVAGAGQADAGPGHAGPGAGHAAGRGAAAWHGAAGLAGRAHRPGRVHDLGPSGPGDPGTAAAGLRQALHLRGVRRAEEAANGHRLRVLRLLRFAHRLRPAPGGRG